MKNEVSLFPLTLQLAGFVRDKMREERDCEPYLGQKRGEKV